MPRAILSAVFVLASLQVAAAAPACPTLEPVDCVAHIREALVLDGQVMTCPNGIRVYASLTLQGGSRIESGDIDVVDAGSITARGTQTCPVYLTSAAEHPAAGDWQFHIHPAEDIETSLTWTVIEYAGERAREAIETTASDGSISFEHVSIRHAMGRTALDLRDGRVNKFSHVSFGDVDGSAMEISPDEAGKVEPNIHIDTASVTGPWVHVRGNRLDTSAVWENIGVPYLVEDFSVHGTLTIDRGARVLFGRKADLRVEASGRLIVSGTGLEPVRFDSVSLVRAAGDWNRVVIASTAGNHLAHVDIRHGGGNNRQGAITVTKSGAVRVDHVSFANNLTCDIKNNGGLEAIATAFRACP